MKPSCAGQVKRSQNDVLPAFAVWLAGKRECIDQSATHLPVRPIGLFTRTQKRKAVPVRCWANRARSLAFRRDVPVRRPNQRSRSGVKIVTQNTPLHSVRQTYNLGGRHRDVASQGFQSLCFAATRGSTALSSPHVSWYRVISHRSRSVDRGAPSGSDRIPVREHRPGIEGDALQQFSECFHFCCTDKEWA